MPKSIKLLLLHRLVNITETGTYPSTLQYNLVKPYRPEREEYYIKSDSTANQLQQCWERWYGVLTNYNLNGYVLMRCTVKSVAQFGKNCILCALIIIVLNTLEQMRLVFLVK